MNADDLCAVEQWGAFHAAIGLPLADITTPALLVHLEALERNIATMAATMKPYRAVNRPHIKVHKCPHIARAQMRAGAVGVCAATVWEAVVMARAGIADILVANEVVGDEKIEALLSVAGAARLSVLVDAIENADDLDAAAARHGVVLDVLVDLDTGMGRCGVGTLDAAVALADHVSGCGALRFRGVQGYEGHCMEEPRADRRLALARRANEDLQTFVEALETAGFPCPVVSAGGTGTWRITGPDPVVTELQAGSYVFMDAFHRSLVTDFEIALTVLATVISRHDPRLVLDAGSKSITPVEAAPPILGDEHLAVRFDEEHAILHVDELCRLRPGDKVQMLPGYAPSTVCMYDVYHVVKDGHVVDVWPIVPRGPGHAGIWRPRTDA
jgi:D-serine deaminase-like pyridoxal phosphate-dependent protein